MAIGIKLDDFRANVKELARPNRFLLSIPSPPIGIAGFNFDESMQYHVRSSSQPGRTLGDVTNLYWQGMNYKIAGDPTYDDINIIFLNNVNYNVKELFERWMDGIANSVNNVRLSHNDYKAILKIDQLGKQQNVIATYYIHGAWPKSLEPIEMAQETVDAVEEFTITFSIDSWSNNLSPGDGVGTVLKGTTA